MQQRSEETHANILEAAHRLFSRNGYDATGVAEICAEAGVSKGAFYHHFPTKQAVFLALMNGWLNSLEAAFNHTVRSAQDFPQALLQMADMVGQAFQYADIRQSIFLEFWTQAQRDPVVWQAAIAPYQRYLDYFAGLIRQGIEQRTLRPVDPEIAARTLVSLSIGMLMQSMFNRTDTDWGKETQQSIQLLLDGLGKGEA